MCNPHLTNPDGFPGGASLCAIRTLKNDETFLGARILYVQRVY
jgi:hypothetical protein